MAGIQQLLLAAKPAIVSDPNFEYTTLLLPGNGTNGAQNNTFLDGSTNNFTITRNGNTTQGTFSPFSQTGWGNYFDGTANGSLRADSSADTNLSADFTIQAWVFPTANGQSSNSEIMSRGATTTFNGWHLLQLSGTTQLCFGVNYSGIGNTSTSIQSSTNIPLNQWTHVAVTRSGNTARIYINGSLDTTNTGFTTSPTVSGTEYVYIGRGSYDTTNRQFTGYVSNASIIKGTALTTFNTTTPLSTSTSGQSLLTCTSNRFIDTNTATTAKTLTVGSGASVQAFSPFNPTAAWSAATNGGSGYFDGSGDYLTAPANSALAVGSGDFTIEAWVYITGGTYNSIYETRVSTGDANGYVFSVQTGSGNGAYMFNNVAGVIIQTGANTVFPNAWNHVAFSRSGTTLRGFVNGTLFATVTNSTNFSSLGTSVPIIGYGLSAGSDPFVGYISNFRIVKGTAVYTAAFTPPTAPLTAITNTSLLTNFTNAGIYDATSKNDLETAGNAQISTTQSKFGGSSIYLDGTGDYVVEPINLNYGYGTGDFTIEFWLYLNATSTQTIVSNLSSASSTNPHLYINTTIRYYTAGADRITGASLSTGVWYHIALCRASGSTRLFVDGTQSGSTYSDTNDYGSSAPFGVGTYWSLGSPVTTSTLSGYIDDLRITKGIARYTANFTPPTAAFPLL